MLGAACYGTEPPRSAIYPPIGLLVIERRRRVAKKNRKHGPTTFSAMKKEMGPKPHSEKRGLVPDLRIEETLAVYIPLPTFFFVSPNQPKLAERIKVGLEMMYADGSFDEIFYSYHMKMIADAKLGSRKIFPLANLTLPKEVPLDEARYWFKPGDELNHIKNNK